MQIRLFEPGDVPQIARLFHDTVRQINIKDYSLEQTIAWSPDDIYFRDWLKICSTRFTYIAEQDSKILGFSELEANGHIDYFYVHYQHQNQGVGSKLYRAIAITARKLNLTRLYTEASITAKPFFLSRGFTIVAPQQVSCRGVEFTNYLMEKEIIESLPVLNP